MKTWIRPVTVAGFGVFILGGAFVTAIIGAFSPVIAAQFAAGANAWLEGIPDTFYEVLMVLGGVYTLARSADKFTQARHGVVEEDRGAP